MVANLDSGFFAEPAWHGEGVVSEDGQPKPLEDAFQLGGLDWEVEKLPIYTGVNSEGGLIESTLPNKRIVRMDTNVELGIVGDSYQIMQNAELRDFLSEITHNDPNVACHALGSLGIGERIWMLVKVPGQMVVNASRDDVVDQFIVLASSHDGSLAINLFWTPIRVVCQNTLQAALSGFKTKKRQNSDIQVNPMGIVCKHTKNVSGRVQQARKSLAISNAYFAELGEIFVALENFDISTVEFDGFLDYVFPIAKDAKRPKRTETARGEVTRLFEQGAGNRGRTAWDAYNGLTEYCDYDGANFRNTAGELAEQSEIDASIANNRFESTMLAGGSMAKRKSAAFEYLAEEVVGLDLSLATMV